MKYIAIIDADEKPVSCEFIGCNGNVTPYLIGTTTNIKALDQEPKTGYISIDDVMSVFDDFMRGDADEEITETFLEMLKDKAESEVGDGNDET